MDSDEAKKHVLFPYIYYFRLSLPDYLLEQRCGVGAAPYHLFFFGAPARYLTITFLSFFLLFPFPGLELGTLRSRCPSMTWQGNERERCDKKKGVHADGVRKRSREPGGRELAAVGDWKRRDRAGSTLYSFLSLDLLDVLGCYCSRVIWVWWGFSIWCPNIIVVDQEDRGELDLDFQILSCQKVEERAGRGNRLTQEKWCTRSRAWIKFTLRASNNRGDYL